MGISMIVAMDLNRAIGKDNALMWNIKEDLSYFKKITNNKAIVMGRKTFESIGRPLPNRTNIVLSRDKSLAIDGVITISDIDSILEMSKYNDIVVIGGEQIYKLFLPYTDTLYITQVNLYIEDADAHFPSFEEDFETLICGTEQYSKEEDCIFNFNLLKRK